MDSKTVRRWREAHPNIDVLDESFGAIEDFPSLRANDVAGAYPDAQDFILALRRECEWAYHLAAKAQAQSDAEDLIASMLNETKTDPAIRKFLVDYAKANNIRVLG